MAPSFPPKERFSQESSEYIKLSRMGFGYHFVQFSCFILYTQSQFNKYRVQVSHLEFIKYDVYGVYTYFYKKLGTRTLVRIIISIITLFLGKNRLNLHHFPCSTFSRNIIQDTFEFSLQFHSVPPSAVSSCLSGSLGSKGVMGPGSSLKAGARGRSSGPLKKKNKYKIRPNGFISLELEKSQQFM